MAFFNARVLAVLVLALHCAILGHAQRVAISSTVRLDTSTRVYIKYCNHILAGAKKAGSKAVQFIPAGHFVDMDKDGVPERYCYSAGQNTCLPTTKARVLLFQKALFHCFRKAYQLGFEQIFYTPHLNDAFDGQWRNVMKINPYTRYSGGVNYYDAFLAPAIRAANLALPPRVAVLVNLQGEMNGALISYPKEWRNLGLRVRRQLKSKRAYFGLNLNWNKVCAWCTCGNYKPCGGAGEQFDNAAIQQLFKSADFIGTSSYAPTWNAGDTTAYVTPSKIEGSLFTLQTELAYYGVDLLGLNKAGKPLIFGEFGVGGGTCETGRYCVAQSAEEVAKYPFFGIWGGYDPAQDPWKNPGNRQYRQDFYKAAIQYAANNGKNTYGVSHLFLWNDGSYDVQGIQVGSTRNGGSWRDDTVAGWIEQWNKAGTTP